MVDVISDNEPISSRHDSHFINVFSDDDDDLAFCLKNVGNRNFLIAPILVYIVRRRWENFEYDNFGLS